MTSSTETALTTTEHLDGGVAVVRLNRPDHLNAFNFDLVDALEAALEALRHDVETRVIVLGAEGRAFSAGLDLADLRPLPGTEGFGRVQGGLAAQERLVSLAPLIHHHPKPIIAAVGGAAAGMGMAIALAADIRVVSPKASFAAAFIRVGLGACDFGTSYFLPHLVGAGRAAEILLTGRKVPAPEILDLGLASDLVDEPIERAIEIARSITAHSPFGVAMTKQVLWANITAPSLEAAMALENRTQTLALLTEDMGEAVGAFIEKRPANYANR
ncbi:enoyl-CoA hydratase/isomerase family protein [Aquihabitans sp. McL0605]|uniref:enoyl-CoA hydratase/isomerase family protein n=1 Tax=Aquihabitans sp. McL0605 TaxID=3415671 RepID=UPI003CF516FA